MHHITLISTEISSCLIINSKISKLKAMKIHFSYSLWAHKLNAAPDSKLDHHRIKRVHQHVIYRQQIKKNKAALNQTRRRKTNKWTAVALVFKNPFEIEKLHNPFIIHFFCLLTIGAGLFFCICHAIHEFITSSRSYKLFDSFSIVQARQLIKFRVLLLWHFLVK